MTFGRWVAGCGLALGAAACGGDGTGPNASPGRIFVDSDPRGAAVYLDGTATGLHTPDTLRQVASGTRRVEVRLDSAGVAFATAGDVNVTGGGVVSVVIPLLTTCNGTGNCVGSSAVYHDVASLHFATNPAAMPFFNGGRGDGLKYPGVAGYDYASVGAPVFTGVPSGIGGIVALGVYPFNSTVPPLWAGRPAPPDSTTNGTLILHQSTWIVPPALLVQTSVPRGLQVDQRIVGRSDVDGALFIRVVFRNISATSAYRFLDPPAPAAGITYSAAYVGWGMDADIGTASTLDDLYTFIPALNMAVMYDAPMSEPGFSGPPALVGLRMIQGPAGASTVSLGAWPAAADWLGTDQPVGWFALTNNGDKSGSTVFAPEPVSPGDYRISVAAGPITLAPGDSVAFTVAVVLALPAPNTYTPGTVLHPGDPNNPARPFQAVAAPLIQRARAAEALSTR